MVCSDHDRNLLLVVARRFVERSEVEKNSAHSVTDHADNILASSRFNNFPVGPFGMSSMKCTVFGHLKSASRPLQYSITCCSEVFAPGFKTITAATSSPYKVSGTPTTAAAATSGC